MTPEETSQKDAMQAGVKYTLDRICPEVKIAIRMGMEKALRLYDSSPENVDAVYSEWCSYINKKCENDS